MKSSRRKLTKPHAYLVENGMQGKETDTNQREGYGQYGHPIQDRK
jgi:hypothetical protein